MSKIKKDILHVQGIDVGIYTEDYRNEYISLTDIARYRNSDDPRFAIQNWMRNRNTIEFLGLWESLHNPTFNRVQFDTFKNEAGLNRSTRVTFLSCQKAAINQTVEKAKSNQFPVLGLLNGLSFGIKSCLCMVMVGITLGFRQEMVRILPDERHHG